MYSGRTAGIASEAFCSPSRFRESRRPFRCSFIAFRAGFSGWGFHQTYCERSRECSVVCRRSQARAPPFSARAAPSFRGQLSLNHLCSSSGLGASSILLAVRRRALRSGWGRSCRDLPSRRSPLSFIQPLTPGEPGRENGSVQLDYAAFWLAGLLRASSAPFTAVEEKGSQYTVSSKTCVRRRLSEAALSVLCKALC